MNRGLCRNRDPPDGGKPGTPLDVHPEQEFRMEKIMPRPNVSRFFDSPRDELKIVDRMVIRDDPPKWRGDHSFSADAATYSLTKFIEPQVAKLHPNWTREQVREQALEKFEKRLRQDQSFEKKESEHEESSVVWQPIQTENGWELATVYGDTTITLSELWEHTREFAAFSGNPAAYNAQEHATQLRMQDEFLSGEATGFVSVLSHPDSIRYVQVWNKTNDGSIVSTHIDLHKTTGRDVTHEEGAALIRHLQSVHGGDAVRQSTYAHFFVRGESISEHDIRTVAISRIIEVNHARIPRKRESTGDTVLRDTFDSMVVLGAYLRNEIERKISDFKEHTKKKRGFVGEHLFPKIEKKYDSTPQRIRTRTKESIKSILADWWVTKRIFHYADYVPVAGVAALTWTTRDITSSPIESKIVKRTSEKTKNDSNEEYAYKSPVHKKFSERAKEWIVKSTKKYILRLGLEKTLVRIASRTKRAESNLPRVVSVRDVLSRFVARVGIAHWIDAIHEIKPWGRILSTPRERIRRFIDVTKRWFRGQSKSREPVMPVKEAVLRFAFLIWRVIRVPHSTKEFSFARIKHSAVEARVPTETNPPQWLLLSIIRYLSMLREVGFSKKKQKKKKSRSLLWHHITLRFVIE